MVGMVIRVKDLNSKIEARDRQIAKLEAALLEKRRELALEVMAHEKTLEALKRANQERDRLIFGGTP
jgi:prefoldin subunit 5